MSIEQEQSKTKDDILIDDIATRRAKFIEGVEKTNGEALYSDPKLGKMYLSALKDADSQAQTNKRLDTDAENAKSMGEIAQSVVEFTSEIQKKSSNPFRAKKPAELETPEVKQSGEFDIKETEKNKHHGTTNYSQFMEANMKSKKD